MDKKLSLLICDDDSLILKTLSFRLKSIYDVTTANTIELAEELVSSVKFELAILDINFEGQDKTGAYLQDLISRRSPSTAIVLHSGDSNIKRICEAKDRKHLAMVIKGEDSFGDLLNVLNRLSQTVKSEKMAVKGKMLTYSPKMQEVINQIDTIIEKNNKEPILILGESGVGKEHLVKYIAKRSGVKNPVCENMASIPETLAESKLFGHKKGAFTGAIENSTGLFEQAHGGILFMDEMGEAISSIQAKILRVLQEKEVIRVGENSPRKIDVRFIAGTHCDLEKMILDGKFREDLYYRLNSFIIKIPPLRERKEDIMFLASSFLDELNFENKNREIYRFSIDAEEALTNYSWPGNIRELYSFIKTINVTLPSKYLITKLDIDKLLESKNLNLKSAIITSVVDSKKTKKRTTKELILSTFEKCARNKKLTAESLGIDRATVYRTLERAGI
jgi:DNA-binding NtrC family response regulator